jgi:integrase
MTQESIIDKSCSAFPSQNLNGISKKRLRVRGKKVNSTDDVKQWIYELIVAAPKTPKQLQKETGFSAMHVWRYAKQLVKEGTVEKDGHYYKKKGLTNVQVGLQRLDELLTKQSFSRIAIIQPLIENMKRRDLKSRVAKITYAQFRSICTGRTVPTFKCHPTDWHVHETTIAFREEYFKYKNTNRLPIHIRFALRYFYQLCLKYPLSEMEALQLGIDGGNDDAGKYADCKFSNNKQFEQLINYYLQEKNDLELSAYVSFAAETFGRPRRVFEARIEDFHSINERILRTKTTWGGLSSTINSSTEEAGWSYDQRLIADRSLLLELYPPLREKIVIESIAFEIFEGKLYESKTNVTWPKEIRNPLAVSTVEKWLAIRKESGDSKIFGNRGESFIQFAYRINVALRGGYKAIGLTHRYFYKRPSYALRHCGAHIWLVRTGYNYDAVASMGWEDINTLRIFYGKYDPNQRRQSYRIAY